MNSDSENNGNYLRNNYDCGRHYSVLINCLRKNNHKYSIKAEELSQSDWEEIIRLAAAQKVIALLYHRLKKRPDWSCIEDSIRNKLQEMYYLCVKISVKTDALLYTILRRLTNDNIPVIPLKGAHLGQEIYGNIALRQMNDIDILVKKKDLAQTIGSIRELGFSTPKMDYDKESGSITRPDTALSKMVEVAIEEIEDNYGYHIDFYNPNSYRVEIHWDIIDKDCGLSIDNEGIWKRAEKRAISGVPAYVMSIEDLLVYLCIHEASAHLFTLYPLRTFFDIDEIITRFSEKIRWDLVEKIANDFGAVNHIYLVLLLAKQIAGTDVPDSFFNRIKPDSYNEDYSKTALINVFSERFETDSISAGSLFSLWKNKGIAYRIKILYTAVFPNRIKLAKEFLVEAKSPRIYLYYFARLFKLLKSHGKETMKLLLKDKSIHNEAEKVAARFSRSSKLKNWLVSNKSL